MSARFCLLPGWRSELSCLLQGLPLERRPAIRRASQPDWLLACDLPLVAGEETTARFLAGAEAAGWRWKRNADWLLLNPPLSLPDPGQDALQTIAEGELHCAIALLLRHGGSAWNEEDAWAVLKAAETGPEALDRLCARFHGEWAALLRQGKPLPGGLVSLLMAAGKGSNV